jgi:hypothetical protein
MPDSSAPSDSSQPKLKRKKSDEDSSYVNSVDKSSDPDRPHLFRGKSLGFDGPVTPSLRGLPPDMHQEVAVSDMTDRPEHVWDYTWANPDDEAKMKAAMEDVARTALGLNPPPAPAKPAPKAKTTSTAHKPKQLTPPPEPAPLLDEQFRVFELAYGSGATMVLSAHTDGSGAQEKFVTLVAQPELALEFSARRGHPTALQRCGPGQRPDAAHRYCHCARRIRSHLERLRLDSRTVARSHCR